jgi:hypothetical protein
MIISPLSVFPVFIYSYSSIVLTDLYYSHLASCIPRTFTGLELHLSDAVLFSL